MATKHIPQRTCIACRTVRSKREFVRVVRTAESRVQADSTGKKAGRGAYLCRQRECWDAAMSSPERLKQALKLETSINSEDLAQLREYAATLPPRPEPAASTKTE
ncbi:MAG TPA: YlxR family protein [Anaerolineae bacterium]